MAARTLNFTMSQLSLKRRTLGRTSPPTTRTARGSRPPGGQEEACEAQGEGKAKGIDVPVDVAPPRIDDAKVGFETLGHAVGRPRKKAAKLLGHHEGDQRAGGALDGAVRGKAGAKATGRGTGRRVLEGEHEEDGGSEGVEEDDLRKRQGDEEEC